jgi:hypothetical protein
MTATFQCLYDFLGRTGSEVSGRSGDPPSDELVARMRAVAAGTATEAEIREVCESIRGEPHLVRMLADLIREALTKAAPKPGDQP